MPGKSYKQVGFSGFTMSQINPILLEILFSCRMPFDIELRENENLITFFFLNSIANRKTLTNAELPQHQNQIKIWMARAMMVSDL